MFIRGPWILDGKLPETGNILHKEIRNSFSSLGELSNIYLRSYSHFLKYPWMTIIFFEYVPVFPCTMDWMLKYGLNAFGAVISYINVGKLPERGKWVSNFFVQYFSSLGELSNQYSRSTYKHSQKTRENIQVGFEYFPVFFVLSFASIFI